jgi:MFS family permease
VSGISLAAGPVLGGLLVAGFGWRGIFWFNVGFGLLALAAARWTLPESSDRRAGISTCPVWYWASSPCRP